MDNVVLTYEGEASIMALRPIITGRTRMLIPKKTAKKYWKFHPLGAPNRNTLAVYKIGGHVFALGRYSQYSDPKIIYITRHYTLTYHDSGSSALRRLRKFIRRDFPRFKAIATFVDGQHTGQSYIADNWVYILNRKGQKKFIRSL